MKENLKPYVYMQWKYDLKDVRPRTFCRTVRRVAGTGEVKSHRDGAGGKPSPNKAEVSTGRPETG